MALKIILFTLLVSVAICDQTYSRYYRYAQTTEATAEMEENSTFSSTSTEDPYILKEKVNITVYYETLCPASIEFFLSQLRPLVERMSTNLDIHLIPYGHATTRDIDGSYEFRCQHGRAECYGNMLHACVLDVVPNRTEAILFNACLMQNRPDTGNHVIDYIPVLNWCGHKLRVLIHGIWDCVNSLRGGVLLKQHGEETHILRPHYVPYIMLDGVNNEQALDNLLSTVCQKLRPPPVECNRRY